MGIFDNKNRLGRLLYFYFFTYFFIAQSVVSETILGPQYLKYELSWCIKSMQCLALEVADTPLKRRIGLMKRPSLKQGSGMIFIFQKPVIKKFWMFNTLIPLDIIFVKNNKIIYLEENVPICTEKPCSVYGPENYFDYAIELNSGDIERLNIKLRDQVELLRI